MTERKYVPIFLDWLETTQDLSAEEKGNLIDAVVSYASGMEYEHLLTGGCRIAFRFLKGQVDRSIEISEKRSKAASKSEDTQANASKRKQAKANGNKSKQTDTNPVNNNNNNNKEDNNNNNKRFVPPTLEEVSAYCRERNNGIDPQHFIDYYTQGNWVLKNGRKMADWKAAVRTWEGNGYHKPVKVVPAYEQRDYSGEDADAFNRMIKGVV